MHPHTKFEIPTLNNMRYAPDMIILKTRSEVKVTVTWKWNATLHHPKMHPHTKFGIPTSKNIRDMLRTQYFLKLGQRSRWPKNCMWHSCHPKMHLHTKFGIPISKNIGDMHKTQCSFLETRSEVKFKVTVTQIRYATLRHSKMHPNTKFEIPTSNTLRDMLRTRLF